MTAADTLDDLADLDEVNRARNTLAGFMKESWRVVEGNRRLWWNWHLPALAEHLEAVLAGQLPRLIISVPPGTSKPCYNGGMVTEEKKGLIPLSSVRVGDRVLTHLGRYRRVVAVHEQGVLPLVEIFTCKGRVLRVEKSHPLLTARGWVEAGTLTTDDVLAEVHPTSGCGTKTVTPEEARIIGYLIGDGSVGRIETSFTNQDSETLADFSRCAESLGFRVTDAYKSTPGGKTRCLRVIAPAEWRKDHGSLPTGSVGPVREWRKRHDLDVKNSYTKRVPDSIYAADDDTVGEFLAAYWACDGSISDRRDLPRPGRPGQVLSAVRVNATTVSEELARGVQRLLTRLGMSFVVRQKTAKLESKRQPGGVYYSWQISAEGQDTAAKFLAVIGSKIRHTKKGNGSGLPRNSFDRVLTPDRVRSVTSGGEGECRCLTVAEDSSFSYEGVAVHNSRLGCVFWPAWAWIFNPSLRWMFVANSATFASRDSMACRRLVESEWYQRMFRPQWRMRDDQNQKTWYQTTDNGDRQSYGVGANITGQKADIIVLDDPLDAHDAQTESARTEVIDKFENTIRDRLIDSINGSIVAIGHRVHKNDLTGHLKSTGEFFELMLPEEYDPKRSIVSPIGFKDPRTKRGELLRPKQYGPQQAAHDKSVNPPMYQAKRNQNPRSAEGVRFKSAWFRKRWSWDQDGTHILLHDANGTILRRIHSVDGILSRFGTADGAASIKTTADYTVICSWIRTDRNELLWMSCRRERLEIPDQPDVLEEEYRKHQMEWCGVEGIAGNVALLQFVMRRKLIIRPLSTGNRDKLARSTPAQILAETGRVYLPDADTAYAIGFPLADVLDEITGFTGDDKIDDHDDIVDNFSYAAAELNMSSGDDEGSGSAPSGIDTPPLTGWNPLGRY